VVFRCDAAFTHLRFLSRDKIDKDFGALIEEIERKLGGQAKALSRMRSLHWKALCSFTHTGIHQVTPRYTAGQLRPNYPAEDLIKALNFASAAGLLAAAELAALSNDSAARQAVVERMREFVKVRPKS
jgi:hypothetical protein